LDGSRQSRAGGSAGISLPGSEFLSTSRDHVAAKNVFSSMKQGVSTGQSVTGMTKLPENCQEFSP